MALDALAGKKSLCYCLVSDCYIVRVVKRGQIQLFCLHHQLDFESLLCTGHVGGSPGSLESIEKYDSMECDEYFLDTMGNAVRRSRPE